MSKSLGYADRELEKWGPKPIGCPFCGGKGELAIVYETFSTRWEVGCRQCRVSKMAKTAEGAVLAWNQRDELKHGILWRALEWQVKNLEQKVCEVQPDSHDPRAHTREGHEVRVAQAAILNEVIVDLENILIKNI